jgi:hypothetical protein
LYSTQVPGKLRCNATIFCQSTSDQSNGFQCSKLIHQHWFHDCLMQVWDIIESLGLIGTTGNHKQWLSSVFWRWSSSSFVCPSYLLRLSTSWPPRTRWPNESEFTPCCIGNWMTGKTLDFVSRWQTWNRFSWDDIRDLLIAFLHMTLQSVEAAIAASRNSYIRKSDLVKVVSSFSSFTTNPMSHETSSIQPRRWIENVSTRALLEFKVRNLRVGSHLRCRFAQSWLVIFPSDHCLHRSTDWSFVVSVCQLLLEQSQVAVDISGKVTRWSIDNELCDWVGRTEQQIALEQLW